MIPIPQPGGTFIRKLGRALKRALNILLRKVSIGKGRRKATHPNKILEKKLQSRTVSLPTKSVQDIKVSLFNISSIVIKKQKIEKEFNDISKEITKEWSLRSGAGDLVKKEIELEGLPLDYKFKKKMTKKLSNIKEKINNIKINNNSNKTGKGEKLKHIQKNIAKFQFLIFYILFYVFGLIFKCF